MENSHSKIEAIFEIVDGLDDLDKEAWMELINKAEQKQEKEIMKFVDAKLKESHEVLNAVLPLIRLARLMIASEEVSFFQRTIIVRPLIQELIMLLTPIQVAGVLTSLIYTNFERGKPQLIPMMITPADIKQAMEQEREDDSLVVV